MYDVYLPTFPIGIGKYTVKIILYMDGISTEHAIAGFPYLSLSSWGSALRLAQGGYSRSEDIGG